MLNFLDFEVGEKMHKLSAKETMQHTMNFLVNFGILTQLTKITHGNRAKDAPSHICEDRVVVMIADCKVHIISRQHITEQV